MLMKWLLVGMGGGLGAMGRFGVQELMQRWSDRAVFPIGTMTVNVLGCLLIGAIGAWLGGLTTQREDLRLLLAVGILGGFTTFSAFSLETIEMVREGHAGRAVIYVALSNVLCVGAAWAGWRLTQHVVGTE